MRRLNKRSLGLAPVGLLASLAVAAGSAAAADLECEPAKLATKYPGLASKTIKIGQDGESAPYSYRDPKDFKHLIGLDADLARAVFECAGVPVEFVTGGWSGLLPAVIAGQTDVMWDSLYYTPERAKQVDFVTYLTAATGGLVAKGNPKNIKSVDDVCGVRATAGLGTVEEVTFRELSAKCTASGKKAIELVTYPDMPGGTRLVANDRADLLMSDLGMVDQMVIHNPKALERGFQIISDYKIAVAYTKNNKDLGQALLDGLTIMKNTGKTKEIFEKYNVSYDLARTPETLEK
jgi:polar amino acid transport system substrate-binding protein